MTRSFALGVGLTNACDLSCSHCYRGVGDDALSIEAVLAATDALPTRVVNFGTGENGLHPRFGEIVVELRARGIAVTMTTNGKSAAVLDDATLAQFADVEFSIDYPTQEAHDAARAPGNWDLIASQMARCRRLGVSTTIIAVLMSANHRAMRGLAELARSRGSLLRINVYQPVRQSLASPSFDEFWYAWSELLAVADVVACGEPILRAVLGLPETEAGCGAGTVRLTPRGEILACVYRDDAAFDLASLCELGPAIVDAPDFRLPRALPAACAGCAHRSTCRGGCASRRQLGGGMQLADRYCPFVRGVRLDLASRTSDDVVVSGKAASACTTILRPRPRPE